MARRTVTKKVASFVALAASSALVATAHPLCYYGPDRAVSTTAEATFCDDVQDEGFCCEPDEEAALQTKYDAETMSKDCAALYKEVLCGICNPYSAHLYTRLAVDDGLAMKGDFCKTFVEACGSDLKLGADYCDEHVLSGSSDEYWSYPLLIDDNFSDNDVTAAFPDLPEDELPTEPMAMQMTPDGNAWWVAGMAGQIKLVDVDNASDAVDVLDISSKIEHSFEQGLMGFALSPSFSDTGLFYVSYGTPGEKERENAINVLSKFIYYAGDMDSTYKSEEVLITTTEKGSSVHSSGWLGFPPSSYGEPTADYHDLYWTVGDGGPQNDPDDKAQDLSLLHGSMVRISVPSNPKERSYKIPAGNASGRGDRPEICAWGLRNPFRCGFDRDTDELYCGDVGQDKVEEVDIIECGKDYGWRMFEGSRCNDDADGVDCGSMNRADYSFPIFEYCHFDFESSSDDEDICGDRLVTGLSVIGGYVYRGKRYADILGGHYIFADHSTGVLHHLAPSDDGWAAGTILSSSPKVAGFAEGPDGELYLIGYQGNIWELPCGNLCGEGSGGEGCLPQAHSTPTYDEIGCFNDDGPRALGLSTAPACDTMSPEICASYCATIDGATHFGVQYQRECYCGGSDDDHAKYGEVESTECNMPCSGYPTERCGGDQRMNVYTLTGEVSSDERGDDEERAEVLEETKADNYVGCYADDKSARALTLADSVSQTMTYEECESFCSDKDATIFAMEYGTECYCGNDESDFEEYGESDGCDYPCAGDGTVACGGYLSMSVYSMGASTFSTSDDSSDGYVGCFTDVRKSRVLRAHNTKSEVMTATTCKDYCRKMGSTLCGLQYGEECWCGDDSFKSEEVSDSFCDYTCSGDDAAKCGGYLYVGVYKVD